MNVYDDDDVFCGRKEMTSHNDIYNFEVFSRLNVQKCNEPAYKCHLIYSKRLIFSK